MLFSTTIPKKELVVDFSISDVTVAIKKVPSLTGCSVMKESATLKKYDLNFKSFASMGNKLSITLEEISDSKTKISTEITRAVGTFNQAHEVQSAETDYVTMTSALAQALENPNMTEEEIKAYKDGNSNTAVNIFLTIIFVVIMLTIMAL